MIKQKIFIVVIIALLLVPFAGMSVSSGEFESENSELAEAPELLDENGDINVNYLPEAGAYFEDHFAFRSDIVNLNSLLQGEILHTSSAGNIVVGKDGWLYYGDTLDDYQRTDSFSERELYNIAHNLKLMQDYLELLGSKLYFVVGPDKATIYPENMPYYMLKGEGSSNYDRLLPYLDDAGVRYINVQEALLEEKESSKDLLYYKYDTHWNLNGADIAADTILEALGIQPHNEEPSETGVHYGDLAEMLYPQSGFNEEDAWRGYDGITSLKGRTGDSEYYELPYTYEDSAAVTDSETYMDDWIEGTGSGDKNLFVFRDSFGSALVRPLASAYENSVFSRLEPYALVNAYLYEADDVLIVLAERNIKDLLESPAIMQGPAAEIGDFSTADTKTTCEVSTDGGYYVIEGSIDPKYYGDSTEIYVNVYSKDGTYVTYIPFYTEDCGYKLYVLEDEALVSAQIVVSDGYENTAVLSDVLLEV